MLYVVLESEFNVITPIEDAFIQYYHESSIVRIGSKDLSAQDIEKVKQPPLFNREWLIICGEIRTDSIGMLKPDSNTIILKVTKKHKLNVLLEAVRKYQYVLISNMTIEHETMIQWIVSELGTTQSIAQRIYKRAGGRTKLIVTGVQQLSGMQNITAKTVDQYIESAHTVNISMLVQYVLGISSNVSYDGIIQFLYTFRHARTWLRDCLVSEILIYLEVFKEMDRGNLDITNFRQFKTYTENKIISALSEYRLQCIVESHRYVSTELVYYLWLYCQSIHSGVTGVRQILMLVKTGGNNVYNL